MAAWYGEKWIWRRPLNRYAFYRPMIQSHLSRRALLARLGAAASAAALTACNGSLPTGRSAPTPTPARTAPTLVLATAELVVGRNRFAVGIIDEGSRPIVGADVTFGFYQLAGQDVTKRFEEPGIFRWVDQKSKGIYTASVTFDAPGRWGVEAVVTRDGHPSTVRAPFEVQEHGSAPTIGTPAIRSKTPTTRDVQD